MFQTNSWLIRFLNRVCDLIILNILLLISCMTVVFAGDGMVSLYAVTLRMFRDAEDSPASNYLRGLRENFIPSVPAELLLLTNVTLLASLRKILYAETLVISPGLFIFFVIAAFFLTALLSYLFPLLARFENSFLRHLENAGRLAVANLPVTMLLTAVNLLPVLLPLFFPELLGVVIAFWLLIGFSAGAYVNSFYLNRIFH